MSDNDLDEKEQKYVRMALGYLRTQMGGLRLVADALRSDYRTLLRVAAGQTPVSASTAIRTARLLDASIDDLLAGRFQPGVCPKCGHRLAYMPMVASDFVDESTAVEDEPRNNLTLVK